MIDRIDVWSRGIPFRVVYLPADTPSEHYPVEHKIAEGRARVEFYDRRYDFTPDGQFVSRYYAEDLINKPVGGINLAGGIPEWRLDNPTAFLVWSWILARQGVKS